jgi:VWFA-related protein
MMGRPSRAVLLTLVVPLAVTLAAQDPKRPPVFRSRTTAVSLDVSVMQRNRPVAGLTAADFAVTDNGVPQIVDRAFTDVWPIDVTLILHAGDSMAAILDDVRRNAQRVLGLLRPGDRARVLVIETKPYELLPTRTVDSQLVLPEQRVRGGASSIHDAILAGLVTRPEPDRRRLVVAITHGVDGRSITSAQSLERVARRTDTVLHVISIRPPPRDPVPGGVFPDGTRARLDAPRPEPPSDLFERTLGSGSLVRYQQPTRQERDLFETLPALTGGAFHGPGRWGGNVNVVAAIRDLIDEFRQSYVVQYIPRDVEPGGWHDIAVRVRGVDQRGVRTRAGYFDTVP